MLEFRPFFSHDIVFRGIMSCQLHAVKFSDNLAPRSVHRCGARSASGLLKALLRSEHQAPAGVLLVAVERNLHRAAAVVAMEGDALAAPVFAPAGARITVRTGPPPLTAFFTFISRQRYTVS